ncbi:MAG TPA: GNAT family N-acetyltransferase [Aquihabitans sp.]|nr:GNAT family N-acetyltransferase [Aquihabitans sp.]
MLTVRSATDGEIHAVGDLLAAAFEGDPVWSWMAAPSDAWAERAAGFFRTEAGLQLRGHGEVLVDDELRGAAVWVQPGRWKTSPRESTPLVGPSLRLFRGRTVRALRTISLMERRHPVDPPHWYLAILGTHPDHQGKGVGGALIGAVTERCDTEGLGAYLESSKEENVALYARHGFEVREELPLPGGPPMWLMWREPRR